MTVNVLIKVNTFGMVRCYCTQLICFVLVWVFFKERKRTFNLTMGHLSFLFVCLCLFYYKIGFQSLSGLEDNRVIPWGQILNLIRLNVGH